MNIEPDTKLDYSDVLIRPKRSTVGSRADVDLHRSYIFRNYDPNFPENINNEHYKGIPLMASNMDGVGTFEVAEKLSKQDIFTCLVKTYSAEELVEYFSQVQWRRTAHVAMSIGITDLDRAKLDRVMKQTNNEVKYVCVDVANGYSERFTQFIKKLRDSYPHVVIIAGNVVTREMTEELLLNGADIIKVGIGPGSVCTTRIKTGVGYPQLSAVIECADAAHGLGGHIIADGGCSSPGDVAKAFAAGADYVMLGGMLAGTDEGGGEVITKYKQTGEYEFVDNEFYKPLYTEEKYVKFYGMSSKTANDKHFGGLKDYRSSEGRTVLVPYKGSIETVVQDILGGVRSAMTYCGATKLKHFSKCATFVRCTNTHNRAFEQSTIGH